MTWLAVSFATLFVCSVAVLTVVLGCLDDVTAENRRLKRDALRRIRQLEQEKKP